MGTKKEAIQDLVAFVGDKKTPNVYVQGISSSKKEFYVNLFKEVDGELRKRAETCEVSYERAKEIFVQFREEIDENLWMNLKAMGGITLAYPMLLDEPDSRLALSDPLFERTLALEEEATAFLKKSGCRADIDLQVFRFLQGNLDDLQRDFGSTLGLAILFEVLAHYVTECIFSGMREDSITKLEESLSAEVTKEE